MTGLVPGMTTEYVARQSLFPSPNEGRGEACGWSVLYALSMPGLMILTGGQTGVDRAALDEAVARGIAYGGWCPQGGWAEDMPEPPGVLALYPQLRATRSRDPVQRTEWNVLDADACLILVDEGGAGVSGGTVMAETLAAQYGKPQMVIDVSRADAAALLRAWLDPLRAAHMADGPFKLAIGGPRESEAPGIYAKAGRLLREVLGAL